MKQMVIDMVGYRFRECQVIERAGSDGQQRKNKPTTEDAKDILERVKEILKKEDD